MPPRPLQAADYERIDVLLRAFAAPGIDRVRFRELSVALLPVFDADDVSVAIHAFAPETDAPPRAWYFRLGTPGFEIASVSRPDGHPGVRAIRRSGRRILRQSDLPAATLVDLDQSGFLTAFREGTGYGPVLLGHLGTRPGESLGRLHFFREQGREEFDEDRVLVYSMIHPVLSDAARRVLIAEERRGPNIEIALVDAAGQVLWMSDGFRFVWNATDSFRLGREGFPPSRLLADDPTGLAREVALRIVGLADGKGPIPPVSTFAVPRGIVRGDAVSPVSARFDTLPGTAFGWRGRILRITLRRDTAPPA